MRRSRVEWVVRVAAGCLLVALVAAPASAQWRIRNCTTTGMNLFVRDVMLDLYYWYDLIPDPNPVLFDSPEQYLEFVRHRPLDSRFSYITSRAANEALFSASQYVGFGFSMQSTLIGDGQNVLMRVTEVYPESPAAEAGLARGDRILSVGGKPVTQWWLEGRLGEAFGPSEAGFTTSVAYQRGEAAPIEAAMTKRAVTIPTVSRTQVIERDGRRIGYVYFRNFVEPSVAALDEAFARLAEAKVSELVLDLRYNGGGLVSVAQHLASLIGGTRTNGQVMAEYFHNAPNAYRNRVLRFEEKAHALTLDRLVVIATRSSASASELVINALRPFMPVIVIGDTTFGKPVGMYGIDFCDRTLAPVSFTMRNANGEGDFFGGFAPTCPAADDIDRQLGDAEEASLAEALRFIQTGGCTTAATATARRLDRRERAALQESGFRAVIGAW